MIQILSSRSFRVVVVLGLGLVLLIGAWQLTSAEAGGTFLPAFCDRLSTQPRAIQDKCSQLKIQAWATAQAAAQARPRVRRAPTPNWANLPTPVPPGYILPQDRVIEAARPADAFQSYSQHPNPITNVTSVWRAGSVLNRDPMSPFYERGYGRVLVWAMAPTPPVGPWIERRMIEGGGMPAAQVRQYDTIWHSPRNIGAITITGITDPNGVIAFTSSSGVSGTLDMATGSWSLGQS
ncbi:MAG TPA: hypothetical protein VFZ25_10355 [Chloroflexota bacterium]|nr:hypothetical protein [Chloroflexota bacterium]